MKGILKLFPAALAVVALASCSNDDLLDKNGGQAVNGKTMEATIEDFTVMTRAAFVENKDDEGKLTARALVWNAGDSYKVYGELATPDKYTLQNAYDGKKTGTFDLMTDDYNTEPAFAVFPYDKVEADRASKKLTVNLTDWTYATADVKEDGYNQGGFVSNVPMYGICDEAGDAAFGYMTGILRVDLSALPKKMTRLIVVTERPLTGTFETEFDPSSTTYPEIASPVSSDEATEEYDFTGLATPTKNEPLYYKKDNKLYGTSGTTNKDYENGLYFLEIGTESVAKRTNKTFFIAVPTGNKYKVFDILIEYNMGSTKKYELVGQLGNTYRSGQGKSILNWQRGKIKSLTKEITVTASGNTPKEISAFLAAEWKSFPEGADINITVDNGDNTDADRYNIVLSGTQDDDTFTIPAELKGKTVNIIANDYSAANTLYIVDDDPAPVASKALRQINFKVESTKAINVDIIAPETEIGFMVPEKEGATAKYNGIGTLGNGLVSYGDMAAGEPGLFIGENVSTGHVVLTDGSLQCSSKKTLNIQNDGNYEVLVDGLDAGDIKSSKNGAITVKGQLDADNNNAILTTIGKITAQGTGAVKVENVKDAVIADGGAKQAGAITINNVEGVSSFAVTSNASHAAAISISKVTTNGITSFEYAGKGAVTFDDIVGNSTKVEITNPANTSNFTMSNIKDNAAYTAVTYAGKGNVSITGVTTKTTPVYPTIKTLTTGTTATPLTDGNVALTDVTISTTLTKNTKGSLTITGVRAAFGDLTNADGAISITGNNVASADIASITQKGTGIVTLKEISNSVNTNGTPNSPGKVTSLIVEKATTVNYENTFIADLGGLTSGSNYNVTINGTKSSGIGTVTTPGKAKFTYTTDTWDGSSWCKVATEGVYTSGSLAGLLYHGTESDINLLVSNSEINLGSKAFQLKVNNVNYKGINAAIEKLIGGHYTTSTGDKIPFAIKNLNAESGLFATTATAAGRGAGLEVEYVTLDTPVITATHDAGALIGIANGTQDYKFTAVSVKNATIASASTGKGSDINLGGFIGQIDVKNANKVELYGCNVATAAIKGHYYMGGFIGQIVTANQVLIVDVYGGKTDTKGSTVSGITFTPLSADNAWSTLKCGTIAPFIGGISELTGTSPVLRIYGKFDSFDRTANKWNLNFLTNESYKFIGTKQDDCNFIGYIDVAKLPVPASRFKYYLKNLNGFEADEASGGMEILSATGAGAEWDDILATQCNAYAQY